MHLNNLVVAVQKTNGDTLRESSVLTDHSNLPNCGSKRATIYLPFDTEYSLFFKNTANVRAVLDITIDGTSVLGGTQLVIEPRTESRLERFILNGDLSHGRRFKFVALSDPGVQNPAEPKNGLVEITCQWEYPPYTLTVSSTGSTVGWFSTPSPWPRIDPMPYVPPIKMPGTGDWPTARPQIWCGRNTSSNVGSVSAMYCSEQSSSNVIRPAAAGQVASSDLRGATVEGSESAQKFSTTSTGLLQPGTTRMTFQILAPITANSPVTVKDTRTQKCPKCEAVMPARARFCSVCGTSLGEETAKFCSSCGVSIKQVDNFCASCGTRVVNQ